jgi:hypothetical protein
MIKKALASAGIALALIVASPLAANAYTPIVPAEKIAVSDSTPVAGQAVTVAFTDAFNGNEQVTFTVRGEGAVTIAAITSASVTKAAVNGAASVVVTPPSNASGTYTVSALSASGISASATITVVDADGNPVLASTGGSLPIAAIWIAGGVLVLGVVLVSVVGIRRRSLSSN